MFVHKCNCRVSTSAITATKTLPVEFLMTVFRAILLLFLVVLVYNNTTQPCESWMTSPIPHFILDGCWNTRMKSR